jgi:serine/threonine protein kinase
MFGAKEFVGTLDYVSPEVLLRKQYDERIDLWAIGCIAYELWIGVPPFYHQLKSATISNIVEK